jgi:parallel beta-helix repeat protein
MNGVFISKKSEEIKIEGNNKIGVSVGLLGVYVPLPNGVHGIEINESSKDTVRNNIISGNTYSGVLINNSASENVVANNAIGTDKNGTARLGNGDNGVEIDPAKENQVWDNLISNNGGHGIILTGSPFFLITKNVIHSNTKSGIVLEGPNTSGWGFVIKNWIGTDRSGTAEFGNGDHGISIDNIGQLSMGSGIAENVIAFNNLYGIELSFTKRINIYKNVIRKNEIGISCDDVEDIIIVGNSLLRNLTENIEIISGHVLVKNNRLEKAMGTNTGIHLTNSTAVIEGNLLIDDVGDAILFEQGSEAVVKHNNIFDNQGFGLNNLDPVVTIQAQANWWGHSSGPSGAGPGSGDAVSTSANFSNWLTQAVSVRVAVQSDTVILPTGSTDTVSVFFQNWLKMDDVLDVNITDDQGWLQGASTFSATLADSLAVEERIAFTIPSGTPDGTTNDVQVIARSQSNPTAAATTFFAVLSENVALSTILVLPDSFALVPGDTAQFTALGLDQFGAEFDFTPEWSATGGSIDTSGLYVAGQVQGTFLITAREPITQVQSQAVVLIDIAVDVEQAPAAVPSDFHLYQHYPNPFNPETRIQYSLSKTTHIRIDIFNTLGQKIRTLVNEQKSAGSYTVVWDGSLDTGEMAPSGVYIYRLITKEFKQSKKLLLLR